MQINTQKHTEEQGRSLIEMLAVLAVIGVLVVLGVAIYFYAINRYKAEELSVEGASMALTTSIKISQAGHFQVVGNLKYPYTGTQNEDRTFTITISEIPKEVCSAFRSSAWTLPAKTLLNDAEKGYCKEENTLAFTFHNSLYDGPHPELTSSSASSSTPPPSSDLCDPCQLGCADTCTTETYWCGSDSCMCFNGTSDPPYCQKCSKPFVIVQKCNESTTTCCPDHISCTDEVCP